MKDKRKHIGDFQWKGRMVMGTGSLYPDGKFIYTPANNLPIETISRATLLKILGDYLQSKDEPKKTYKPFKKTKYDLNIYELVRDLPLKRKGSKLIGEHPIHGSSTGCNFEVDLEKNCWFCFRHWTGGGYRELFAVLNGIVKCGDSK